MQYSGDAAQGAKMDRRMGQKDSLWYASWSFTFANVPNEHHPLNARLPDFMAIFLATKFDQRIYVV